MVYDRSIGLTSAFTRFIRDNDISFTECGVELNRNLIVICGYISFLLKRCPSVVSSVNFRKWIINNVSYSTEFITEFDRIMSHAIKRNYHKFWETEEAGILHNYYINVR